VLHIEAGMKPWVVASAVAVAFVHLAQPAAARDNIWMVGSSTMHPFTKAAAQRAAKAAGGAAPVVEETGTALGFEYLCGGTGAEHPDATSATRRMRKREFDVCQGNRVSEVVEIPVGLDILVIGQSKTGPAMRLTLAQIYLALARQLPDEYSELGPNPHRKWSEVDRALPDAGISVRVLPPVSGTREALLDLFLHKGARSIPTVARFALKGGALPLALAGMRVDHPAVVVHDSDETIVRELVAHPDAVGVFAYRVLQGNGATVRGIAIDGVEPTAENAYTGRYAGTRRLYLYVRKAQLGTVRGLDRLGAEYLSSAALGPGGYLLKLGFLPLPVDDMVKAMAVVDAMPPVRREMLPE
jgi:phosphate transport system substrate-binding protein